MIDGMKIILERMKTHPEEFVSDLGLSSRWENLVHMNNDVLTNEEKKAFNDAIHELRRQRFTARVLEVLMEEPTQLDPDTYTIKTAGRYAFNSPTTTANAIRLGQETLDEDTITHMKEHLKQLKIAGKI